jgi:hypothetical protein
MFSATGELVEVVAPQLDVMWRAPCFERERSRTSARFELIDPLTKPPSPTHSVGAGAKAPKERARVCSLNGLGFAAGDPGSEQSPGRGRASACMTVGSFGGGRSRVHNRSVKTVRRSPLASKVA